MKQNLKSTAFHCSVNPPLETVSQWQFKEASGLSHHFQLFKVKFRRVDYSKLSSSLRLVFSCLRGLWLKAQSGMGAGSGPPQLLHCYWGRGDGV